ncbi:MAG: ATP-binding protein [Lachnospiraceae bacterium]|jgi:predicted ATP-dependent endonuclease of OLD family|nr:ATP-binding protein [Lachnospiraceae bacterium]
MKISCLDMENFMIFDKLSFNWSPNINIICGENSTGKTTLLKLMYASLKSLNHKKLSSMTQEQIENVFVDKLQGVFMPDEKKIGRLVSRRQGSNKTLVRLDLEKNDTISIAFSNRHERHAEIKVKSGDVKKFEPIYIPPKEMISATEHFQSLYEHYDIDFEEMYYDLTKLLDRPLKRGANTAEQKRILASFEKIMDGNIVQRDKKFYLRIKGAGEFEMGLVSEGYRKLATIIYLIASGSLDRNAVLFWDEPETNMNPKMMKYLAEAVAELAKMGVQVFITTHDYFVQQSFNLIASYPKLNKSNLAFHFVSLYKDEDGKINYSSASRVSQLEHNSIMEEFDALYMREQDAIYEN